MEAATATLVVGLITAATTSLGWIVLHFFTREREIQSAEGIARRADRTRRLEIRLNYYERQIQEFYAPLYSNIRLIWNVWRIGDRFEKELPEEDNDTPKDEIVRKIRQTLDVKYFFAIHGEIRSIIKTKLFLIEGVDIPESYTQYLEHSVTEDIRHTLIEEAQVNTTGVKALPWPDDFPKDVKAGLDKAMRSYEDIIQELGRSASMGNDRRGLVS